MDTAVALVETYLRINGYFTVTEYPVIELARHGGYRTATDLDVLAFRFPGAGRVVLAGGDSSEDWSVLPPDPVLGVSPDRTDMVIGEVKEGRAELNRAARDPTVLQTILTRFGCCSPKHAPELVREILRKGHVLTHSGHGVRFVAFGSTTGPASGPPHTTISLGHVTSFLQDYIRQHWDILHNADFKDPAFGFLVMLEKARQGYGGDP